MENFWSQLTNYSKEIEKKKPSVMKMLYQNGPHWYRRVPVDDHEGCSKCVFKCNEANGEYSCSSPFIVGCEEDGHFVWEEVEQERK